MSLGTTVAVPGDRTCIAVTQVVDFAFGGQIDPYDAKIYQCGGSLDNGALMVS
jgi:hypothetical protein